MYLKYKTGENVFLNDVVAVDLFGYKFSGNVVYAEQLGAANKDFEWCVSEGIKGVIVQWSEPEKAKQLLYIGNESESIADYIQFDSTDDEDLDFIKRGSARN